MSYTSPPPPPPASSSYYPSTPPAPPPKPKASSTPARGPPLPPPPPQNEPLELDGGQGGQYQQSRQYYNQQERGEYRYAQQQHQPLPDIPPVEAGWLPDSVREKTTSDLHHLLNTPDLQQALLTNPNTTHPSIPAAQSTLQPLLQQNLALTDALSNLESTLSQRRAAIQSRLLALRALEQQHSNKVKETEEALSQFSPMALYQRLNAGAGEQELLVRGVEESWLEEGGLADEREVESFVRRVKEGSKQSFLRRERRERWDEGRVGGWR
ncbi:uncharacterized protein LTR77_006639 [Saxophila tyrrhenica]|uniref:VPS37 C-terminal domain-containing protein n=1 Tax=Saxophila tyrrhenica TaxID=1690608 RepID=A0AAV9P9G1_9PEZI|nr:hypothetical protein LTR77_006639 [Saxophila tyrrhenica]